MNFNEELIRIMPIVRHRGVIIRKEKGMYECLGKQFETLQDAMNYIDKPLDIGRQVSTGVFAGKNRLK